MALFGSHAHVKSHEQTVDISKFPRGINQQLLNFSVSQSKFPFQNLQHKFWGEGYKTFNEKPGDKSDSWLKAVMEITVFNCSNNRKGGFNLKRTFNYQPEVSNAR